MEELGIGRPSTYAADAADPARPRICAHRQEAPRARGQGPAGHRASWRASSSATSSTTSPPTSKRSSTGSRTPRSTGRGAARLLARLLRRDRRDQGAAHHRGAGRAERAARRRTSSRDKGDGSNPRTCPTCGTGQLSLKLGKFGAFVGCSNYPECKLHPPARRRRRRWRGRRLVRERQAQPGVRVLGNDPDTGLQVTLRDGRFGPYVQLGEARREAQALLLPKGMSAGRASTSTRRCALLSLPREVARASRERRADPGRHRPLRPLRAARQDLRQSRQGRRRARDRRQPRHRPDRRQGRAAAGAAGRGAPIPAGRSAGRSRRAATSW